MFKKHKLLLMKLAVFTVMVVGFSLFMSGGKVHAWDCPNAPNDVPGNWGMQYGGLEHTFASVVVYAHEEGKSYNDGKLNVNYRLNSSVDKSHSYGPAPPGVPASLYPNARIFKYKSGVDDIQVNGRTDQRWFSTGETLTSPGGHCDGWDEIGPGTSSNIGNGFILDCQEKDTGGTLRSNHFWIDQISTPTGAAGLWGGNWTVKVSSGGRAPHGVPYPMGYSSDPDPATSNNLLVENGDNARVDLTWHPNPPPGDPPPGTQECSYLRVYGGGQYKIDTDGDGTIDKSWDTDTYVRVTYGHGPNNAFAETGTLVQGDGGALYNHIGSDASSYKEWSYKPKDFRIKVHVIRKYHHLNGTTWVDTPYQDTENYFTCYDASCDLSVDGNVTGRPNGVQSRSGFTVNAHIHNNAGPPESTKLFGSLEPGGSQPLILTSTSSPVGFWFAPGQVPRNADAYGHWNVNEPGWSIGNYGINAKLFYDLNNNGLDGADFVVADCTPTSYDVYKQFHLDVTATVELTPSVEDPSTVKYTGRADGSVPDYPGGIDVNYGANGRGNLYAGGTQCVDNSSGTGHTAVVYTHSCAPPSNHAGDKYILDFCVAQTDGWIGPSNLFSTDTTGNCNSGSAYVYDRPYLSLYGADAVSGSNFRTGDTCTDAGAQTIRAFRSLTKGGSGAQYAAIALDQISGFRSASVRSADDTELSFANVGVPIDNGPAGQDRPNDGGKFDGQSICSEDFYSTKKDPADVETVVASANINTSAQIQDKKQTFFKRNGNNLTITSNGSDFDKQATLFVDGNVIINSNIKFQPGKYLAIIAKGNIYINKNVTRLDGIYVAQPRDDGSRGSIYTCANGSTPYTNVDDLYANCRTQLVVNGAFAAKSVKFLRVANSLRDSSNHEVPNFSDGTGTKAAEIFNFSPEIYLYTPVYDDVSTNQPYQYLTTLPPVL